MNVNTGIVTALIGAAGAIVVAGLSLWGAMRAQRASQSAERRQKDADRRAEEERADRAEAQRRADVEAQAYERARVAYERIVRELELQLDRNQATVTRFQEHLDQVFARLAQEQDVSNALRNQVHAMQRQVVALQEENEAFRRVIAEQKAIAEQLREDLKRAGGPRIAAA